MKHQTITVTRPEHREALEIVARHLYAFAAGLTDCEVMGYLLDSSRENANGYTVHGAVYYDDTQPEEVQV